MEKNEERVSKDLSDEMGKLKKELKDFKMELNNEKRET